MFENSTYNIFKRLALIGAVLALCVVVLGAYVRLTDAGLGCPDWPGCFGTMTVPESETAIANAQQHFPEQAVQVGKAWREMAHRYLAGTLGLVVLALFAFSIKLRKHAGVSVTFTSALLLLITFQALLGMWTVTMLLKPAVVTAHLIGGMTTLALLTWLAHRHWWGHCSDSIINYPHQKRYIRIALLVLFAQIFLGGWTSTNYAALACTDFPTCHGSLWPDMNFKDAFTFMRPLGEHANGSAITLESITAIQWVHRIGAVVTLIYFLLLSLYMMKFWQLRTTTLLLMTLLLTQVGLGISNLVLHLPLMLAVAHNMVAALLVIVLVTINSKITGKK
jgi:cytochrome c oxidase assembly protein subunit 15